MQIISKNKFFAIVLVLIIIASAFFAGVYSSNKILPQKEPIVIDNAELGKPSGVDFSKFWDAWSILNEKFIGTASTTDQEKVWGAIQGLTSSYKDPYTVFFPPEESSMFESDVAGNFEGVGMEVGIKDGQIIVVSPLKNSPAEKAGIKAGDKILKIDNTVSTDLAVDKAVRLIRGKKGTTVTLLLSRDGKKDSFEIKVVRDVIQIPTLETEIKKNETMNKDGFPNNVFVIKLYNFSAASDYYFRVSLRDFIDSGSNKLVLDLRGNPGGYLEAAVDMASFFLPVGKTVLIEKANKNSDEKSYKSRGYDVFNDSLKMVILVDGGSASASEILAGALKEHGVAKLVGTKTFGKGSVQELIKLTEDTSLKVTVAQWLTPLGRSISKNGLKPDYEVQITQKDLNNSKDPQMDKAVSLLIAE